MDLAQVRGGAEEVGVGGDWVGGGSHMSLLIGSLAAVVVGTTEHCQRQVRHVSTVCEL